MASRYLSHVRVDLDEICEVACDPSDLILTMRSNYGKCSLPKKRPMTPAERARRYRERRKLKLMGISTNLLEQALNASTDSVLSQELRNGERLNWRKDASEHHSDMDSDNTACCNQDKDIYETSRNTGTVIKIEPVLTENVSQDDEVSQDGTTEDSIPGCSRPKGSVSELEDCMAEVDHITSFYQEKLGNHYNYGNKIAGQKPTNDISAAAKAEKWMIKWNGDRPIAEPVCNEVLSSRRSMTAVERKRKSRAKQRVEEKFFQHKSENCSCGTSLKTMEKLKAEVDALTQRKELLSAQITLLQAQPRQTRVSLTVNDSEEDFSNVSTNDSSAECSRLKDVSFDSQTKMKRALSVDKVHEISSDGIIKKAFFGMHGMLDDFQIFGEFVATELKNLKSDVNRRRLKRMIQKMIIEVSESEDQ